MLRAVVLTQNRRVADRQTDRQTDGFATALAMRALRRAVKMELSGKTVYDPVLKTTQLSARAQNHACSERWKAHAEFLLTVFELLFTARAMLALQALY